MSLDSILSLISKSSVQLTFFVLLIFINIALLIMFFRLRKKIDCFLQGKDAKTLEESINNLIGEANNLRLSQNDISKIQEKQEKMLALTIKKIGVIRFNPFNNTGGDQSFAIALLNSNNSGIIISSLFLREGTRIYAKPVNALKSSYPLSKEEEEAIKKALNSVN